MSDLVDQSEKKAAESIVSDAYAGIKSLYKKLDVSQSKLTSYLDGLKLSLSDIQIMGMSRPKKITELYVNLRLQVGVPLQSSNYVQPKGFDDVDYVKHLIREIPDNDETSKSLANLGYGDDFFESRREQSTSDKIFAPRKKTTPHLQLPLETSSGLRSVASIDKQPRSVILAGPGAGKTTLLKYCALVYAGHVPIQPEIEARLPIFVTLRDMRRMPAPDGSPDWLLNFCVQSADDVFDQYFTKEWLEQKLVSGQCVVFLDGIDEIPTEFLAQCMESVEKFSTKYRRNKVVASCRAASYRRPLAGFSIFAIEKFSGEDISSFIANWFANDDDLKRKLIADLEKSESGGDLCSSPLMATMLCVMYEYSRTLPTHRAELYDRCIEALMVQWDAHRAIDRARVSAKLTPKVKRFILSKISRITYDQNTYVIRRSALNKLVNDVLEELNITDVNAEDFIDEICENHGFFVDRTDGTFSFSHLSFQEFFCATDYANSGDLAELFQNFKKESRYREVILLALELMYNPNKLIVALIGTLKDSLEGKSFLPVDEAGEFLREISSLSLPIERKVRVVIDDLVERYQDILTQRIIDTDEDELVHYDEHLAVELGVYSDGSELPSSVETLEVDFDSDEGGIRSKKGSAADNFEKAGKIDEGLVVLDNGDSDEAE